MNAKIYKKILIILILSFLITSIPVYSKALSIDDIFNNASSFIKDGGSPSGVNTGKLDDVSNFVSSLLLAIAKGVTAISAVVMGINFATQSIEDKAKIKEAMVPWVIGIIITFGAYGIWTFTMNLLGGIF